MAYLTTTDFTASH